MAEITYKTGTGQKGNGIEIYFTEKPNRETRELIKSYGYKWGGRKRSNVWWAILTDETLEIAEKLANNSDLMESLSYPDIEIDDIEKYIVPEELQKREHESNWIFRTKEIDRTKELQTILKQYQNQVVELINSTDNENIIYQLKKSIQYFKKHFTNNYIKRLENRANSPSWVVTGGDGRNRRRDEKMNSRYDKLMRDSIELINNIESRIKKYKLEIEKEKQKTIQDQIQKEIENNTLVMDFKTETREFVFMGIKERKRCYICGNYFICRTGGTFRIFDIRTNEEIHNMKTTDKLQDAKNYVLYLIKRNQEVEESLSS